MDQSLSDYNQVVVSSTDRTFENEKIFWILQNY